MPAVIAGLTSCSMAAAATTTLAKPPCVPCAAAGQASATPARQASVTLTKARVPRSAANGSTFISGGRLLCVIRASHQRPRFDVKESEVECSDLQVVEFVRVVVADHLRVGVGRAQVLSDRQDRAPDPPQVLEGLKQFSPLLAKTHHQSRFGGDVRGVSTRAIEQLECAAVSAA